MMTESQEPVLTAESAPVILCLPTARVETLDRHSAPNVSDRFEQA